MMKLAAIHIGTDQPEKLAAFYKQVLNMDPVWSSQGVTGFMVGEVILEITAHDQVSGQNQTPARVFFDLMVDDARTEFARIQALGATVIQEPYDHVDEETQFTVGTLADPDGNYFQVASQLKG
jgi:predicted enzyme related to lactoylglutathione lyase